MILFAAWLLFIFLQPTVFENSRVRLMNPCPPPAPRPSLRWMCSYFRQLIESWPRAGRLSAGGQTKASSSVMVPEASPLSIDPLSPNFCVTYARLNSHYCAHWSLIGENNRPVVTEGQKYERASPQCQCKLMTSPPRALAVTLGAPRAGRCESRLSSGRWSRPAPFTDESENGILLVSSKRGEGEEEEGKKKPPTTDFWP